MFRSAILLSVAIALARAQTPSHEQVDKIFAKWDSTISPGCALSVIQDGKIVYKRGYGMADLDHDIPITPQTVFHVASISKQFTAAAILLLAQEGKLSLDDDVRKYIPELPDFGVRITLRHLIYHTSGLRDQWSLLGLAGWRYSLDLITDDDVLDLMSRQKELNFKPGDQHVYCNTGYTLLAQIVKRVSGQTFREFTTQRIFAPLDMPSTHFRDDHAEIVKHIAYGYIDGENGAGYRLSVTNFDTVGATSLLTTVEDLAHWDENFYHPRVGGATMVEQQLQRGKLNSGKELDYAFGLAHGKYRGLATVDHGGADAGYRADLLRFPEQHFSVACLCNKGEINPGELTRKVADVYLGKQFKDPPAHSEPPIQPVTVSEAKLTSKEHAQDGRGVTLAAQSLAEVPFCLAARSRALCAQYSGLYWKADDNRAVRVFSKDGKLFLAPSTDESLELTPLSESRFRLTVAPVTIVFEEASLRLQSDGAATADLFARVAEFKPRGDQLAAFAGDYRSAEIDPVYRITVENGGLVLKRLKSKPEKLEPTVQDHFMGLDGDIHFERDSAGQITGFVLDSGRIKNFHFQKATQL